MDKKLPLWIVLLITWCFCIIIILFGAEVLRIKTAKIRPRDTYSRILYSVASFPHLIKETFSTLKQPSLLIVKNRYPGTADFTVKQNYVDSNYVLLATFDAKKERGVVKLLRLQDQKIIHEWRPDIDHLQEILGEKNQAWSSPNKYNVQLLHPILLSDGSLIFNALYTLIKIDKDSKIVWTLPGFFHHSLEQDADGNIWAPSNIEHTKFFPNILIDFKDNSITEVSPDGKMLFEKSVSEILYENGYKGILLGGPYEADLIHLNDVQPALTSTKYWQKNDLLVSVKNKSMVFLYRPSTNKVIWLQVGPWLNQHDVDFLDSSRIGILGNDVIRGSLDGSTEVARLEAFPYGTNQEYIYDFKTNTVNTPYSEFFKKAGIATGTEGRSDILSNGDLFVEETNNNRLLRGNKKEIIWQYIDRIDKNNNAALSWSRFITKDEFKKIKF